MKSENSIVIAESADTSSDEVYGYDLEARRPQIMLAYETAILLVKLLKKILKNYKCECKSHIWLLTGEAGNPYLRVAVHLEVTEKDSKKEPSHDGDVWLKALVDDVLRKIESTLHKYNDTVAKGEPIAIEKIGEDIDSRIMKTCAALSKKQSRRSQKVTITNAGASYDFTARQSAGRKVGSTKAVTAEGEIDRPSVRRLAFELVSPHSRSKTLSGTEEHLYTAIRAQLERRPVRVQYDAEVLHHNGCEREQGLVVRAIEVL